MSTTKHTPERKQNLRLNRRFCLFLLRFIYSPRVDLDIGAVWIQTATWIIELGGVLHFSLDAGDSALFQSAHLRLGDTDLGRDLHLGLALTEPQRQNVPLPLVQPGDGIL